MEAKDSAVNAEFAKICAISLTMKEGKKDSLRCAEIYGDNEYDILLKLSDLLNKLPITKKDYLVMLQSFLITFLCKRYIINGLPIRLSLIPLSTKTWDQTNLCTR